MSGGLVQLTEGTFDYKVPVIVKNYLNLKGMGRTATTIRKAANIDLINGTGHPTSLNYQIDIGHLALHGQKATYTGSLIDGKFSWSKFHDLDLFEGKDANIRLRGGSGCDNNAIKHSLIHECDGRGIDNGSSYLRVVECDIGDILTENFVYSTGFGLKFLFNVLWGGAPTVAGATFLYLKNSSYSTIMGNAFSDVDQATWDCLFISADGLDVDDVVICDNEFHMNNMSSIIHASPAATFTISRLDIHDNTLQVMVGKTADVGIRFDGAGTFSQSQAHHNALGGAGTFTTKITTGVAGISIRNNMGHVTENSGASTGTGAQQTVAHGLNFTPTRQQIALIAGSATANPYHSAAPDATNIYVTAANGQAWYWATVG